MTLLIVDDEYYLVEGIRKAADWQTFGIDRVLSAYSAAQAREVYRKETVDILLVDVEMPRESGLDLIAWVQAEGYASTNIVLTGHANFDYAKEAISLRVFDYLLKPAEGSGLKDTLERAVLSRRERDEEKLSQAMSSYLRLWQGLFQGEILPEQSAVRAYLAAHGLDDSLAERPWYYSYLTATPDPMDRLPSPSELGDRIRAEAGPASCVAPMDRVHHMVLLDGKACPEEESARRAAEGILSRLSTDYPEVRFTLFLFSFAPITAAPYAHEVLSHYAAQPVPEGPSVIPILERTEDPQVARIRLFIREHLSDPFLDRNAVAQAVHMSPDYLSHFFHKKTGTTLSVYIVGERVSLAKELLRSTQEPNQVIAEKAGFNDPSYFQKQFKKNTGLTPSAYRAQFQK